MTAGRDSSIVERFEVAGPRELRALFASASADEKRDLRTYLGGERFRRLSLAAAASRGADRNPGMPRSTTWTVVVVPDLMGSALEGRRGGEVVQLWPPLPGWHEPPPLEYGLVHSDGAEEPTRATGVLNAYYGELLLRLASLGHDARAFPYDWRRDVETTAAELDYFLERTCPEHARLALVAHGLGGLVARALWLRRKDRPLPGRIILLGTPNRGTDLAARMLAGVDATFERLARVASSTLAKGDGPGLPAGPCIRSVAEKRLLGAFRSFPSLYQMLAGADASTGNHDGRRPGHEALWQAETYGTSDVPASQRELDRARDLRRRLAEAVDPCRIVNVLGRGFPTWQLTDPRRPDRLASYTRAEGDGAVLLSLGRLPGVDPFVVELHHADLVVTPDVVGAIGAILDGPQRRSRIPSTLQVSHVRIIT